MGKNAQNLFLFFFLWVFFSRIVNQIINTNNNVRKGLQEYCLAPKISTTMGELEKKSINFARLYFNLGLNLQKLVSYYTIFSYSRDFREFYPYFTDLSHIRVT
jgi:hypothetical protein